VNNPTPDDERPRKPRILRTLNVTLGTIVGGLVLFGVLVAVLIVLAAALFGTGEGTEDNPDGTGLVNNRVATAYIP